MQYLKQLEADAISRDPLTERYNGCFLCAAANVPVAIGELGEDADAADRARLVLWTGEHVVCVINRYPYTVGHLMVAPRAHVSDLRDLSAEAAVELHEHTCRAISLLEQVMNPQGFNVGINLGSAAGAGVPGHLHRHIVPRWNGDTNFINVVGDVRITPQMPEELWQRLRDGIKSL